MVLRMVRATRRKGSESYQFKRRVPSDLRERMAGRRLSIPIDNFVVAVTVGPDIRFSLRTSDSSIAKSRHTEASAYLDRIFEAHRQDGPISLTRRQAVALSGELYRAWSGDPEETKALAVEQDGLGGWVSADIRDEELSEQFEATAVRLEREAEQEEPPAASKLLDRDMVAIAERLLAEKGIGQIDEQSKLLVSKEFRKALAQGLRFKRRKIADSDFRPDPDADRFQHWPLGLGTAAISLQGIYEGWRKQAESEGISASTFESYGRAFREFSRFVGHDDASRITRKDVLRFKDHRLTTVSVNTVKGGDLAALKSIFKWALANDHISYNPAAGIELKRAKAKRVRNEWFTPNEIRAVLSAALAIKTDNANPKRSAAMRWVPWLCAYSGARVGEIVQLRKQDIRQERSHWVLTITPEAVTQKTRQFREVPLHPHLIEQGFAELVQSASDGPLFMWSGEGRAAWRTSKNRIRDFVRNAVVDPRVSPNHGWRYTFKTIAYEAGIQERSIDAICGHRHRTEGQRYTGVTLVAKIEAIESFPRYEINQEH